MKQQLIFIDNPSKDSIAKHILKYPRIKQRARKQSIMNKIIQFFDETDEPFNEIEIDEQNNHLTITLINHKDNPKLTIEKEENL